jgi:HAD superfamily hydrolase (TIGR01484 family)
LRYLALASDYDGTLASDGRVDDITVAALERVRAIGRKLILVSGRILADLKRVLPRIDLFDVVVAENGAVLYQPGDGSKTLASDKIPGGRLHSHASRTRFDVIRARERSVYLSTAVREPSPTAISYVSQ